MLHGLPYGPDTDGALNLSCLAVASVISWITTIVGREYSLVASAAHPSVYAHKPP